MTQVHKTIDKKQRPVKVLQFGEGNFLRAFVDYMIDIANEKGVFNGNVQIIKPITYGNLDLFREQDCVYTVVLRGKEHGEISETQRVITSVAGVTDAYNEYDKYAEFAKCRDIRLVVSNTTEAGIVFDEQDDISANPPNSFPGKLTKFLYERYTAFNGDMTAGLIMLPVELIDRNGAKLKECCVKLAEMWSLPEGFRKWLVEANTFCSTLVDRIVTGYPKDEAEELERSLGYSDKLLVTGEPFALWVIESDKPEEIAAEFPMDKAGLPVIFTKDLKPYRERKVRLLNGAHTSSVLAAFLAGIDTVGDMMKDADLRAFINKAVYDELMPMVPLSEEESRKFADSVMERFENPFIRHNLLSIALNSVSKFKARVLPTILETYERRNTLPETLCFSIAALIKFYQNNTQGRVYEVLDDEQVLKFFAEFAGKEPRELAKAFLGRADFLGQDLTRLTGLADKVADNLESIIKRGMRGAIQGFIGNK